MSEKLIQSYVEDKWFVSTIYRQSSAALAPDLWYYETMVWPWDDGKRENFTEQHDSGLTKKAALENHAAICARLAATVAGAVRRVREGEMVVVFYGLPDINWRLSTSHGTPPVIELRHGCCLSTRPHLGGANRGY